MKVANRVIAPSALALISMTLCLSGCVVHTREVVHDGGYSQGYKEGYYDSEHHRYWHENAWHDCVENDIHCHD
jgi:hypothetical protein